MLKRGLRLLSAAAVLQDAASVDDAADLVQASLHAHVQTNTSFVSASFDEYIAKFGRQYDSEEYAMRGAIFQRRVRAINAQNGNSNRLWTAGWNHFTDRTDQEFAQKLGWNGRGRSHVKQGGASLLAEEALVDMLELPEEVDHSELKTAQANTDQASCGSCWALATSNLLATRYELFHKKVRTFSPQQLVNCVPNEKSCGGEGGCQGATVELAMEYLMKQGLGTEDDVPYLGGDEKCGDAADGAQFAAGAQNSAKSNLVDGLKSWSTLPANKAEPLMRALVQGPVAVSVGASDWDIYFLGVFDSCAKDSVINHAVLMTGFGQDGLGVAAPKYWKIKNSWGNSWGEGGFIRLKRGASIEEDDAHCGTDSKPEDGVACKPYPDQVTVCGMCGVMYDSVTTEFS